MRSTSRSGTAATRFGMISTPPGASARAAAGPSDTYVFSVAQIVNLLYRRLLIGGALVENRRPSQGAVLQDGILRYRRLAVCATRTAAALNTYSDAAALRWWFQDAPVLVRCPRPGTVRAPIADRSMVSEWVGMSGVIPRADKAPGRRPARGALPSRRSTQQQLKAVVDLAGPVRY